MDPDPDVEADLAGPVAVALPQPAGTTRLTPMPDRRHLAIRRRGQELPTTKDSARFSPTLGGRLAERGLRSANDVYAATGTLGTQDERAGGAFWDTSISGGRAPLSVVMWRAARAVSQEGERTRPVARCLRYQRSQ